MLAPPHKYLINQRVGRFVIKNQDELYGRFLYYFLSQRTIQWELVSIATGSANQVNISPGQIEGLIMTLPSFDEQKAIAHILGALDDKIELNRRMNETLEAIARAIFKSWFVDFEFPDTEGKPYKSSGGEMMDSELGKIPKGWEVKSLDEIAQYLNGLALQRFPPDGRADLPVVKIAELRVGNTNGAALAHCDVPREYIVDDGDVIFSWSGSLMVKIWCGGKGALNQHLFKVTSEHYPRWFYYFWTIHHLRDFQENVSKTAQHRIKKCLGRRKRTALVS